MQTRCVVLAFSAPCLGILYKVSGDRRSWNGSGTRMSWRAAERRSSVDGSYAATLCVRLAEHRLSCFHVQASLLTTDGCVSPFWRRTFAETEPETELVKLTSPIVPVAYQLHTNTICSVTAATLVDLHLMVTPRRSEAAWRNLGSWGPMSFGWKWVWPCFMHQMCHIQSSLDTERATMLVHAPDASLIDYCNTVLAWSFKCITNKLETECSTSRYYRKVEFWSQTVLPAPYPRTSSFIITWLSSLPVRTDVHFNRTSHYYSL